MKIDLFQGGKVKAKKLQGSNWIELYIEDPCTFQMNGGEGCVTRLTVDLDEEKHVKPILELFGARFEKALQIAEKANDKQLLKYNHNIVSLIRAYIQKGKI